MAGRDAFLDRPAARILAAIVLCAVIGLLAYLHRDDILAGGTAASTGDPELDACIAERTDNVSRLVADGLLDPAQADDFRDRAAEFCRFRLGGG